MILANKKKAPFIGAADVHRANYAELADVRWPVASTPFEVPVPEDVVLASNQVFALSPDAKRLAFCAVCPDGRGRLWICALDSSEIQVLHGSESPFCSPFFWSPDSRFIAFDSGGKLKAIDVTDGSVRTLCSLRGNAVGGSWNQQGVIIFGQDPGPGLMKISADGGVPSPLTTVESSRGEIRHVLPSFLPDGQHFVYLRVCGNPADSGLYLGALSATSEQQSSSRLLATEFGATCIPCSTGQCCLLFVSDGPLMAQLFDLQRMEFAGERHTLVEHVGLVRDFALFSASQTGTLSYKSSGKEESQLIWFDREGTPLAREAQIAPYLMLAVSPDEKQIAVSRISPGQGICSIDRSSRASTQVICDAGVSVYPTWSPAGDSLFFSSNREGNFNLYRQRLPRSMNAETEALLISAEDKFPSNCSPDGRFLLYTVLTPGTKYDLWTLLLGHGGRPEVFLQTEFNECHGHFSPCGNWVAYMSDKSGQYEVYVRQFFPDIPGARAGSVSHALSNGGGIGPRWQKDGKQLYYLTPERKVVAVDVSPGPQFRKGAEKVLFQAPPQSVGVTSQWAVSSDGTHFLFPVPAASNDEGRLRFHIVPNWKSCFCTQTS